MIRIVLLCYCLATCLNVCIKPALLNLFQLEAHFKCGIFFGPTIQKIGKMTMKQGGSRIFIGGGGGGSEKGSVPSPTLRARNRTHFRHGVQGPLKDGPQLILCPTWPRKPAGTIAFQFRTSKRFWYRFCVRNWKVILKSYTFSKELCKCSKHVLLYISGFILSEWTLNYILMVLGIHRIHPIYENVTRYVPL